MEGSEFAEHLCAVAEHLVAGELHHHEAGGHQRSLPAGVVGAFLSARVGAMPADLHHQGECHVSEVDPGQEGRSGSQHHLGDRVREPGRAGELQEVTFETGVEPTAGLAVEHQIEQP